MNSAFYSSSIKDLVDQAPETVLGHLAKQNPFALDALQRNAWLAQISILQRELAGLNAGWLAFEFAIPRMGKRADNIILFGGVIFVLEFKVGTEQFDNAARDQVVDYALDLKNFHSGSHDRPVVPIVVATGAPYGTYSLVWADDNVAQPILSNGVGLGALIKSIVSQTPIDRMVLGSADEVSGMEGVYVSAVSVSRLPLGEDLAAMLEKLDVTVYEHLHLAVSIRSFRAEKLSDFVGAVVAGEIDIARKLYEQIKATYPIKLTRNLAAARAWLRGHARGSERVGLVASSGASRLKPFGINVHEEIDPRHWFLNGKDDVRSSHYLEDPATEFLIQGLELDWVGVCWDADFRSINGKWAFHRFTLTKWQNVNDNNRKIYLTNTYRVLLTRARQGMVIYIPEGDADDATRPAAFYDGTAKFLSQCGLSVL